MKMKCFGCANECNLEESQIGACQRRQKEKMKKRSYEA